jgi:nickel/cobalt transporter (NiCoT) family protein
MSRAFSALSNCVSAASSNVRNAVLLMYAVLAVMNIGAWAWALIAFNHFPPLLGVAFLAYTFGLRHAVDADHIAAIDNVTRKLMHDGKRPVSVGFFFSLGHSTIVFGLTAGIALASMLASKSLRVFESLGGTIGTCISVLFLFGIALANVFILISLYRAIQRVKNGGQFVEEEIHSILAKRGLFGRFFGKWLRLIAHSWQMYFIGFLFGLGFDTATEVGLLGISAAEATRGLSIWSILVFPALFTAGMALVDASDGILMLGAYGWALLKPARKLHYNITVTFVSVLVALLIAGIEILGLIGDKFLTHGFVWNIVGYLNNNFAVIGLAIIGIFAASWAVSVIVCRVCRPDELQARGTTD